LRTFLGCALLLFAAVFDPLGAQGTPPSSGYRLLNADDAAELEKRLNSAAAEGFALVAVAGGTDVAGKPRLAALMQRGSGPAADYRVVACASAGADGARDELAKLGAEGYRLEPQTITARMLRDVNLPESAYDDQLTLVLARHDDGARFEFSSLSFGDFEPFQNELTRVRGEGHELLGMWNTGRKLEVILQRRTGPSPVAAMRLAVEHRLLLPPTRLVLGNKLESLAGEGFRILAATEPSITGPSIILLERSAITSNVVDYKLVDDLPSRQKQDTVAKRLNKLAYKGWRVSRLGVTAETLALERPKGWVHIEPFDYRMVSSRRAPGLEPALDQAVRNGYAFVRLFVEPDETTVLVEKPGR
jgi:hypothetical protein